MNKAELTLRDILFALLSHALVIFLATVIFAGAAWIYTNRIPKKYRTTVAFLARNNPNSQRDTIITSDQAASRQLANTSSFIIRSAFVMDVVSQELAKDNIHYSSRALKNMTSVTTTTSEYFTVTISTTDRKNLIKIADTVERVSEEQIKKIMEGRGDVVVLEHAVEPTNPYSPSYRTNVLTGALIGFLLACFVVVIRALTDTTIWSEDDLTKQYDIPVLGTIPQLNGSDRQSSQKGKE